MRRCLFTLSIAISVILSSCDPCKNLDCASDNYYGVFRIVAGNTGTDLVFGPNSIYDKKQIRFYALNEADTTFFACKAIKVEGANSDSALQVRFHTKSGTAYIRFGNADIDTLNIFFSSNDTKCCGTFTEITNFRYNNTYDIPGKGIQVLKK